MIVGDIFTYIPLGYLYYVYVNGGNNVTEDNWYNFGIYSFIAWIVQLALNGLPPLLGLVFLAA